MRLLYLLLAACGPLIASTAHAQASCPAPTHIKVVQLAATSATLSYEGAAGTGSVFGSYSYPGSPKLAITQAEAGTLLLPALPPATPITVALYTLRTSAASRVLNTYSPVATFTFTTPMALAPRAAPALAALTLAPNPARGTTTIHLPVVADATYATLHLRDVLGREVRTLSAPLGQAVELNLADLKSGVYLLQVQASGQEAVQRLVVE